MAVSLRLARHGQKKRPFYRIVAAEKSCWRDGKFLDIVGHYNPVAEPKQLLIKEDKVRKWLDNGAQPTQLVRNLIKKQVPGLIESKEGARKAKTVAARKKRKARLAAKAS